MSGYFKRRGIELNTAKEWELGVDREYRRATFTVRDFEGRLALVIGRDITGKSRVKYSNYVFDKRNNRLVPFIDHSREDDFVGPTKRCFMYGEHKAWARRNGDEDLIVVEGPMDVLKVWQHGMNVVGILGSYLSDEQAEKLVSLIPRAGRLVVMADGDEAGRRMVRSVFDKVGLRVPVFDAYIGEGLDPGGADKEDIDRALSGAKTFRLTSNR